MWLVAENASNSPIKITTMRLFDNQKAAEAYANDQDWCRVICYYFDKPEEKYAKRWEYYPTHYNSNHAATQKNNANFTP